MIGELEVRAGGHRESGAFLLGVRQRLRLRVTHIAYFDDLEPTSLNGAVHLTTVAYSRLGALCREHKVEVLADVHTHPGGLVAQSHIDRDNPLIAQSGHLALIVPHHARGTIRRRDVGAYAYQGDLGWDDRPGAIRHRRWL